MRPRAALAALAMCSSARSSAARAGRRSPARTASRRARVTVTVRRGSRIVRRFDTAEQPADRTIRFSVPARGLPAGDHTVRLVAQSGEDQVSAVLVSRRL